MKRVLFVCLANVCRSPMARAVADALARQRGTPVHFDAAGVAAGRGRVPIDPRASAALARRGYVAARERSRTVSAKDFAHADWVLAMDRECLAGLARSCPEVHAAKLALFLDFTPGLQGRDVPDPYFGDERGFDHVLDLCEAGAHGLLRRLDSQQSQQSQE